MEIRNGDFAWVEKIGCTDWIFVDDEEREVTTCNEDRISAYVVRGFALSR